MNLKTVWVLVICFCIGTLIGINSSPVDAKEEILVYHSWATKPNPEALQMVWGNFEKEYPQYKITENPFPFENYDELLLIVMGGKKVPDVFVHKPGSAVLSFIINGKVEDLTSFWNENNLDKAFDPHSKQLCSWNGRVWNVPFKRQIYHVWYRPSIFKKYGVEKPANWNEFIDICEKLKAQGQIPILETEKYPWSVTFWMEVGLLGTTGADFYKRLAMEGKESWQDQKVINAFGYWKHLIDKGYINSDALGLGFADSYGRMVDGTAAMYYQGTFFPARLFPMFPELDLDYFLYPMVNPEIQRNLHGQADGWFIPREAKNKKGAFALLKYLAAEDTQKLFVKMVGEPVASVGVTAEDYPTYPNCTILGKAAMEATKYPRWNTIELSAPQILAHEFERSICQKFLADPDMTRLKKDLASFDEMSKREWTRIRKLESLEFWKQ